MSSLRALEDEYYRVPDEPDPIGKCAECESEIFEYDYVYAIHGSVYCEDCMRKFLKNAESEDFNGI